MTTISEQKHKVEIEVQIVIKRLIHPQAKEDFDEQVEGRIIIKSKWLLDSSSHSS